LQVFRLLGSGEVSWHTVPLVVTSFVSFPPDTIRASPQHTNDPLPDRQQDNRFFAVLFEASFGQNWLCLLSIRPSKTSYIIVFKPIRLDISFDDYHHNIDELTNSIAPS
jgi:hypothetical protein